MKQLHGVIKLNWVPFVLVVCALPLTPMISFAGDAAQLTDVFDFPSKSARTHCDNEQLRLQSWNDDEHLVVQAILWKDGDNSLGETSDGREVGDSSSLVLDLDFNRKRTPEIDRVYGLNPWPSLPGLRYTIPYAGASSSSIKSDTAGHGSIRYVDTAEGKKARVDTYVIPLAEISLKAGQEIGIAFLGSSTTPELVANSIGYQSKRPKYYAFDLPFKKFNAVTLSSSSDVFDVSNIPDGRDDSVAKKKPETKSIPELGSVPPEFAAADWLNTDAPPTLATLKGNMVLVDFWATWCGPCVAGIPHLNELVEKHHNDGLRVISFTDQSRMGIENFQKSVEIRYPIGVSSELSYEYGVTGLPHTFLIGRDGTLLWQGNPADDGFDDRITNALKTSDSDNPAEKSSEVSIAEPVDPGPEYAPFQGLDRVIDDEQTYAAIYHRYKNLIENETTVWPQIRIKKSPKSIAGPIPHANDATTATLENNIRSTLILAGGGLNFFTAGAVIVSSDGLALTNFHVAKLANQKMVGMTSDGKLHRLVEVVVGNPHADVALVRFEGDGFTPAKIAEANVPMGDPIEIVHHSEERFYTYDRGCVMRHSVGNGQPKLEISARFAPGGSGCGIYNENHEIVGLVSKLQMGQGPDIASRNSATDSNAATSYDGGYPRLVVQQAVPLSAIKSLWSDNTASTPTAENTVSMRPDDVHESTDETSDADVAADETDSAVSLTPGETFYLDFPKLRKTWKDEPARAGVYLPTDYTERKTFPLFVWYAGGAGGDNPSKPIEITNGKGFICVAVPYGSEEGDQPGGWQTPWSFYKTIFDKLETVVPNIDPDRRIAGGASSGGAAVMFQLGNSDEEFQNYFHAFMPAMAGWPMGGLESIKGRPMLAIMGEKDKRLPNYRVLEKEAIDAGVDFQFLLLKDVGHKMPPTCYPDVREWLHKNVIQRADTPATIPTTSSSTTPSPDSLLDLKILYVGTQGERSKDFTEFLAHHFASVTFVESKSLTPEQADVCDVMVIDSPITTLPFGNDKACIMIGDAAARTGRHYGSKIDWLCLCLSNEAYLVNTEHPIFHTHFEVTPTLEKKKCRYTNLMIDAWKVEEPQDTPGLVSSRRHFENAADSEIISGGVNMKGVSGVPLVREANRFLWGFIAPPSAMTEEARHAFVNAIVWMQKFDGAKQTVFRGQDARTSYQGVCGSPYVEKHNLGQWFSKELLERHDYDKESLAKAFKENLAYVHIPRGHGQMEFDEDAKRLQTPNNQIASLEKWIALLDSDDNASTALRLLQRYTGVNYESSQQWQDWLDQNRSKLRFDDTQGYRFLTSKMSKDVARTKALNQTPAGTPSNIAPVLFDRAIVGRHIIDGATYAIAGSQVTLTLRANILAPWHIYSPDYDNGVNKPTQIQVALPPGMEFVGEWEYPKTEDGHLINGAIFSRKIKLKKHADSNLTVSGVVSFQACTSTQCLRPQELKFELPITVVAFEH